MSPIRRLAVNVLVFASVALLVAACPSSNKPKEATDEELAPQEVDTSGQPINRATAPRPSPPPRTGPRASPSPEPSPTMGADGLPSVDAEGPPITVIYVCEIRDEKGRDRPAAAVFTCDPDSEYMDGRPRPSRILKPMRWGKIQHLLADLRAVGFSGLPVEELKPDEKIDGERQIIVIQDKRRLDYRKSACKLDKNQYVAFSKCERVLVTYSSGSDTFYETEGLHPIPSPEPGH